jgi:hypothetical protein
MLKFPKAWLLTAIGLAAVLAIDDWLSHTLSSRLVLIAAAALVSGALINWSNQRPQQPDSQPLQTPAFPRESLHLVFPSELALAIEHLQSIRVLLDVSESYNQAIPRAVLVNLDLVLKHLRKLNGASPSAWDERASVADSAPALAAES